MSDDHIRSVTQHMEYITGSAAFRFQGNTHVDLAKFWGKLKVVNGEGELSTTSYCRDFRNAQVCER